MYYQLGMILVAAVTAGLAIYMSRPQAQYEEHRRGNCNNSGTRNNSSRSVVEQRHRKTRPGDMCLQCLEVLSAVQMRPMNCGHALHEKCYQELRRIRNTCPACDKRVMRLSKIGDDCTICCTVLLEEDMTYLRCEHAMHEVCLNQCKLRNNNSCPLCRERMW